MPPTHATRRANYEFSLCPITPQASLLVGFEIQSCFFTKMAQTFGCIESNREVARGDEIEMAPPESAVRHRSIPGSFRQPIERDTEYVPEPEH